MKSALRSWFSSSHMVSQCDAAVYRNTRRQYGMTNFKSAHPSRSEKLLKDTAISQTWLWIGDIAWDAQVQRYSRHSLVTLKECFQFLKENTNPLIIIYTRTHRQCETSIFRSLVADIGKCRPGRPGPPDRPIWWFFNMSTMTFYESETLLLS